MSDTYMFVVLAPLALAWILSLFLLRSEKPRRLSLIIFGALAVALALVAVGHADELARIEGARRKSFFNEAWLANARERSMRAVLLMLGLGALPGILALVGLIRPNGPLLGPIEPAWVANGTLRTRRLFYRAVAAVVVCLIAGGAALAAEWLNH